MSKADHRYLCIYALFLAFFSALFSQAAAGDGIERLNRFFHEDTTLFAEFDQVVLDETLHVIEESSGLVWFARPSKYRWEYKSPFEQLIVSDGSKTWVFDMDLEQVTVSEATDVIDETMAGFLSGKKEAAENFLVTDLGVQGKFTWVAIEPKDKSTSQHEMMRLAFSDASLETIELLDSLNNTTRIQLSRIEQNINIAPAKFEFEPPEGIDVIQAK